MNKSKEYIRLRCPKCGMVGEHLNTPHWKCPKSNHKDGNSNSRV